MKKIYKILTPISLALFLSACGGSGDDASFKNSEEKITIVMCDTNNPVFTTIEINDTLVKTNTNTTVQIVHESNDNKKVCVDTGSAYLLRK